MTLLDSMMEPCVMLDKVTASDGVFGFTSAWRDGARFMAAVIKNSETQVLLAEKHGVTELFSVVTEKGFRLGFHDVFRRESDGEVFRVTGNTKDSEAPDASTVKIGKVTAERWVLPS